MRHTITLDNYQDATFAMRDILYMYQDLARSYRGFGHGIDTGTFNPFMFVDAQSDDALDVDLGLLHEGSAVALLCQLSDFWDEDGGEKPVLRRWGKEWASLLPSGRLDHLPLSKQAFIAGLEAEETLRVQLSRVYEEYVVGYLRRLLRESC